VTPVPAEPTALIDEAQFERLKEPIAVSNPDFALAMFGPQGKVVVVAQLGANKR